MARTPQFRVFETWTDREMQGGRERWHFVPVPSEPGRWFKVRPCVVEQACPKCGADYGEPCRRPPVRLGQVRFMWGARFRAIAASLRARHVATHCAERLPDHLHRSQSKRQEAGV